MNRQITKAFGSICMPPDCARRIERELLKKTQTAAKEEVFTVKKVPSGNHYGALAAVLVCLALVTAMVFALPRGEAPRETAATTEATEPEETLKVPAWLWIENEMLKMNVDGEAMCVNWLFDSETPFTYCEKQSDGTVVYIALGGDYDADQGFKSIGWYSAVWDPDTRNWAVEEEWNCCDPDTGEERTWFAKALDRQSEVPELADAKDAWKRVLHYTEGRTDYILSPGHSSTRNAEEYHTPFTDYEDGRVYFIANGEKLDITDLFSEEEPYTYRYTDSHLVIHYIAIGGTPENMGYLEMLQGSWDTSKVGTISGYGVNTWNNEAEERYGWEQKAKELLGEYNIYWAS